MLNKKDIIKLIELEEKTDYTNNNEVLKVGNKYKEFQKTVENEVDNFFNNIVNKFELETGDVTPSQVNTINEFKKVVEDYIYNNIKDNI